MKRYARWLLVSVLVGGPVVALRGDDPKAEEVKRAAAAEAEARVQVAQALAARQQVLVQRGGMPAQPGFGGSGMPYVVPVGSSSDSSLKLGPGEVEVRLGDDSVLRVVLLADVLELETSYGKLTVPLSDVRRIDVGLRISAEEERAIAAAVADVGGPDAKKRLAARDVLTGYREKALPAVRRAAAAAAGTEAGPFLADVEGRLKSALPDGRAELSDRDKVVTPGSVFVGRLTVPEVRVRTFAFGEQTLKLSAVRSFRTHTADEADDTPVIPWPGSMNPFAQQVGKTFRVRVTAQIAGGVYGTNTYTMDSYLPSAAIHAGVLKPGETGVVKFKIVPSPQVYQGTNQNGITSSNYPFYQPGAYEILK